MKTRKIFALLMTLLCVASLHAADAFTLGYCEHQIADNANLGQGSSNLGEISAAIYVPQSKLKTLVGNDISRIDVGLISRLNVRNLTVWVRHSLEGENLTQSSVERAAAGWNELTLTTPYRIQTEDEGLYIGFTYQNNGTSHAVSFVGNGTAATSFFRASAAEEWRDMAELGNLSLEAIVTGSNLPLYDLALNKLALTPHPALGENGYRLTGEVSNVALRDISGFTLTLENEKAETQQLHADCSVKSGTSSTFAVDFLATLSLKGLLKVTLTALNEGADANADNNSLTTRLAFQRNVVLEEFTTEQCSNCPKAATGLHQALTSDTRYATRVIPICHHAAFGTDWLTRTCDTDLLYLFNDDGTTFAPAIMFDRQPLFDSNYREGEKDNVVPINLKEDFIECIEMALALPTHAQVSVRQKSLIGHEATFEVSIVCDDALSLQNPILTAYLTEDDIPAQKQAGADGDFTHQHVIRWDNGAWGDAVQFTDNTFSKTYTVTLDESWKQNKLHFVAFLSNHDASNILNNAIENGASTDLDATTAIRDVQDATQTVGRYNLSGQAVAPDHKGITLIRYNDGRVVKVLKK